MKNKFILFSTLSLLLVSCATLNVAKNVDVATKSVCLNADGQGRLNVDGHKYVFSFETLLDQREQKWVLAMDFPFHGQEVVELSLLGRNDSFMEKIYTRAVSERANIDAAALDKFLHLWGKFLVELIDLQKNKKSIKKKSKLLFNWRVSDNKLSADRKLNKDQIVTSSFYQLSKLETKKVFTRMDFALHDLKKSEDVYKIELIVRKCLETPSQNPSNADLSIE